MEATTVSSCRMSANSAARVGGGVDGWGVASAGIGSTGGAGGAACTGAGGAVVGVAAARAAATEASCFATGLPDVGGARSATGVVLGVDATSEYVRFIPHVPHAFRVWFVLLQPLQVHRR